MQSDRDRDNVFGGRPVYYLPWGGSACDIDGDDQRPPGAVVALVVAMISSVTGHSETEIREFLQVGELLDSGLIQRGHRLAMCKQVVDLPDDAIVFLLHGKETLDKSANTLGMFRFGGRTVILVWSELRLSADGSDTKYMFRLAYEKSPTLGRGPSRPGQSGRRLP